MWFMFCPSRPMAFKIGHACIGHHGVEDAGVREEVAHQQQGDELRHRNGDDEQCAPELLALGLLLLMSMARNTPPKKLVKVAKKAHTNVQLSTRPKA